MKKFLIDTHILLWLMLEPNKLSKKVKSTLKNFDNELFVSKISLWEIAIKMKIGKLDIKMNFDDIFDILENNDLKLLDLSNKHIAKTLLFDLHHRDPFDRMLIAQAKTENMTIITKDKSFSKYDIDILR